ncbi:hypothetical protein TrST_g9909 [Triparma strigata]|uniref:Uncharacterized protein n=1 Tax=Triparma strigata TaxID=1606541 RepID=A0A9W7A4Z7_9STRA|nr:hypothetical protein TrST_g9909 [Triparma strigata]
MTKGGQEVEGSPKKDPNRLPLPHESRLLNWHEMQELQFELPTRCMKKTHRMNPGKTIKQNKHMQQQAIGLSRMQRKASVSLKRSEVVRTSLPPKFSPAMHRQNIEDKDQTRQFSKKLRYLADKKAYDAWNKKIAASWENKETKMKAMSKIYGPQSLWGRMEEEERLRLEALNQKSEATIGPNLSPLQLSKAMYDANRISAMVKTNVQTALLHEDNVKKVAALLEKGRAATVVQKAVRAFQKRSWERKFVKIDPLLETLVLEEREVEKHIVNEAAKKQRFGALAGQDEPDIHHSPVDFGEQKSSELSAFDDDRDDEDNDKFGAESREGDLGRGDRKFHEQMRAKVENDMAGADKNSSRLRLFGTERFDQAYEANHSPSFIRPRPRTATGMSDLTRSSGSPNRQRGQSGFSSAGDLAGASRSRYNSELSLPTSGARKRNTSTWGSGGITGMDVNLVNAKERAMRNSAATEVAIAEAKKLQLREKRRRSTILQGISEQVKLSPDLNGRLSPTSEAVIDDLPKRRSSVMRSPLGSAGTRPMSAVELGGGGRRLSGVVEGRVPMGIFDDDDDDDGEGGGGGKTMTMMDRLRGRQSVALGAGYRFKKNKKQKRPSTAGVGSRRPSSASLMSGVASISSSVKDRTMSAGKARQQQQYSRDPSISQIKAAQNSRKMGPRTMARRQEKIIDHHAGGAISLLRERNTVVRKHISKGRGLGHHNTAKNLVAKALHES